MEISLALNLYYEMLYLRMVEDYISNNYVQKNGKQEMRCPVHLSTGQEAVSVGFMSNLKSKDKIFLTHRCHGQYLAKKGSLNSMFAEIYGKKDGCVGGRGGSMHLQDIKKGIFISIPIVGSVIPLSVGSALSSKIQRKKDNNVVFFGDGALEEGVWHESAEFAKLYNLNIIFVCENNLYSVYTPLKQRQIKNKLSRFANTHSIKVFECDGNNVQDVFTESRKAINYSNTKMQPSFLLAHTYRHREHCGPNFDDNLNYRPKSEIKKWFDRDPIKLWECKLLKAKILNETIKNKFLKKIKKKILNSHRFALKSKLPNKKEAGKYVYSK